MGLRKSICSLLLRNNFWGVRVNIKWILMKFFLRYLLVTWRLSLIKKRRDISKGLALGTGPKTVSQPLKDLYTSERWVLRSKIDNNRDILTPPSTTLCKE